MSSRIRIACFSVPRLILVAVTVVSAGCASSRPADSRMPLAEVNEEVTGEDVLMYTGQTQSPRIGSSVTLSSDSIYYIPAKTVDWRSNQTKERPLQQQTLSEVDSLQVERGGFQGGAIGAGLSQTGGTVLMLLGGLARTLLGRKAGKDTETVYRAPEFSSHTSMPNESGEAPN